MKKIEQMMIVCLVFDLNIFRHKRYCIDFSPLPIFTITL